MKAHFISLGCDKNLVDTEHVIGALVKVDVTDNLEDADIIAINTCCFIEDSTKESIDTILEVIRDKKESAKVAVFGCMAKRFSDEMGEEFPELDLVVPSTSPTEVINQIAIKYGIETVGVKKRARSFTAYSSALKISEGCDKNCTYCVIPKIRGKYKSVPMEELIEEAKELVSNGTVELVLVAQESCSYGVDIYGEKRLHILIKELSDIPGLRWIRLMYAYPEEIYDELITEMATNPKFCHYIDMPIQHSQDSILKRMGRRTTHKDIVEIIKKIKTQIPDIAIRTTLICGFPGENESDFEGLLDFVKESAFDNLGAFKYSNEEGSASYNFDNQIDEQTKEDRYDRIMRLQQEIAFNINESRVGKVFECIVDGFLPEDNVYQARGYMHAPDIDGMVFFESERELISGDFVKVKITDSLGYDLKGELI